MDADVFPPLHAGPPPIRFSPSALALVFPPLWEFRVITVIMLSNRGNSLVVEMVKKVFCPKLTRRGAFWGNTILLHVLFSVCILFLFLLVVYFPKFTYLFNLMHNNLVCDFCK